jgi:DNA-binding NarL/FixJ family response regulator
MDNHDYDLLKIVIIEDDPVIREGYCQIIDGHKSFKVINTYSSAENALKGLVRENPDLILLDIGLPGMSGIDAIPKLKHLLPNVLILMMTVHETKELIFSALSNGVSGYLTKNAPAEKIIESIKEVRSGGGSMSAEVARLVMQSFCRSNASPLSKRETQILEEVANGKSRMGIAEELFIDYETVKTHLKNIYFKLGVHSRAAAIKTAKENKFI